MAFRSKSISNILREDIDPSRVELSSRREISHSNYSINDKLPMEDRFKTYTLESFKQAKKQFAKGSSTDLEETKEETTPKSQNLVKKLIASLEMKNKECEANNEFHATYYPRNNALCPSSTIESLEKKRGKSSQERNLRRNRSFAHYEIACKLQQQRENLKFEKFPENRTLFNKRLESSDTESLHQGSSFDRSSDQLLANEIFLPNDRQDIYRYDIEKRFKRKDKIDRKNKSVSSFERNRQFSSLIKIDKYYDENGLNENVGDFSGSNDLCYKKSSRKKSFKDFLGSIVKCSFGRKPKEFKTRQFLSSDNLFEQKTRKSLNGGLSGSCSLQSVVLRVGEEENSMMRPTHNAEIYPVNSVENLVKPSAIKNLTKCVPLHLREEWANKAKMNIHEMKRQSMQEMRVYQEIRK